jgi:transglutaminase superfamily protein
MRLLRKFLMLPADERRLLVRAVVLLALVRAGLGRLPFAMLRRLVTGGRLETGQASDGDRALADQVVWAVTAASRRMPRLTTCLSRALTVHAMLARGGYPSRLQIGVVRGSQGELEGHAWVESDGRILIGGTEAEVRHFTALAGFGAGTDVRSRAVGTAQGSR